jgi:hypothetical protein
MAAFLGPAGEFEMLRRLITAILVLSFTVNIASGLEEPKPDPKKYPQDTAENSLNTMALVFESEDYAYWFTWVVTPDSSKRTMDKYKTLEAAVAASKTEKPKVEGRVTTLELIKKLQAKKKPEVGTDNGTSYARFWVDDKTFFQFEKQKDGRWCFNPRARAPKETQAPATK